ncbi:DNRLRE domain-containing protein [Planosporangium thailandense]|uniref:DNRLRE domain-containing protein n=1 Tax=Planosporangium thailandense TaxID=765197 RepID=A0ABX0XUX6_9ACTN|nr:DNRLRE domain-containing protein [Planosporangium thailandense]NJC69019.1 DNRLRE domain-containing protein [Planosporangium thailandense]
MHSTRRRVVYGATTMITLAATAVATASPAFADVVSLGPTTWAYVDSQAPKTSFVNQPADAPFGTTVGTDHKAHTYRSYFTFDLSKVRGQVVHTATLYTRETNVNSCAATAPIELWRTDPIKKTTTWKNQPAELDLIQRFQRGAGAFCPGYLYADLAAAVNAALARHETSLTVELRIARGSEADPALGRSVQRPGLGLDGNHVPTVSGLGLTGPDRPCGTVAKHPTGNDSTVFKANVADVDKPSYPTARFAVWPADHPDQRREFTGSTYFDGTSTASTDLRGYPDGAVLLWTARAEDGLDVSAWAKPCYLTIDRTAPTKAPTVASSLYPEGTVASGGPGVKGKFRFDAQGDRDTVAFVYQDFWGFYGNVPAQRPGGSGVLEYTPPHAGYDWLDVTPVDAAGNRGPTTHYQFVVRYTAPWGSVDVAGIGLPSRITLSSPVSGVTAFSYQLDGAAEVKFPAVNGTGSSDITFQTAGSIAVVTRSYAGQKMIGVDTMYVYVSDAPQVDSPDFTLDQDVIAPRAGTFTFKPRAAGVVAYVYDFGDGQQRIDAAADGSAVLHWTATVGSWYLLQVQSVRSDGSLSVPTVYQFHVIDPHPTAYAPTLAYWPRTDGVGVPLEIQMQSELPNLTGFAYRLNGGDEQTVSSNGNWFTVATVTPQHAGDNTVVFQALLSDGTRSPETTYTFNIFSGPVVTWSPPGSSGIVGKPMTFTFSPGLPGVREYRYSIYGSDEQTVAAGPDGTATVTYTPGSWGAIDVQVTSVGGDGSTSETRIQYVDVRDDKVSVYSSYGEYVAQGGIGTSAFFTFNTQLFGQVVEYRYHLNDGPEQTLPASTDGTDTWIAVTLDRNGLNTLYVQSLTASGDLSPVTEYRFLVGTAPHVVSAQYPEGTWSGGAGVQGTFEFSGGTPGIVSFDYRVDDGATTTVPADSQGRASVTYTPAGDFEQHTMVVTGHTADGSATDSTSYTFYVSNAR